MRRILRFLLVPILTALLLLAPAPLPFGAAPASAAVYQCGCPASAYAMLDRWAGLDFPAGARWWQVGADQWLFGGAVHRNREGQLPRAGSYREYDAQVYARRGQSRGAKRIVVNISSYAAWYTPNHYTDFYRM